MTTLRLSSSQPCNMRSEQSFQCAQKLTVLHTGVWLSGPGSTLVLAVYNNIPGICAECEARPGCRAVTNFSFVIKPSLMSSTWIKRYVTLLQLRACRTSAVEIQTWLRNEAYADCRALTTYSYSTAQRLSPHGGHDSYVGQLKMGSAVRCSADATKHLAHTRNAITINTNALPENVESYYWSPAEEFIALATGTA